VVKVAGDEGARGVAIAQAFPNPNGVSMRLQREFREAMRDAYPEIQAYSSFQLEGYVSARVLVEGLRRVSGEISADSVAAALKGMGTLDLGGFTVSFGRSNEGSRFVDIGVVGEGGKLLY
jgi:ABC-type branched-subunit amino acid transport system substrate-binding protein